MIEEIAKKGNVAKVLVDDIYRIYFDQIPPSDAHIIQKKKETIFQKKDDSGITEYIFAGKDHFLVEKIHFNGKKKVWAVHYYEYEHKNNKIYPKGIIYRNYLYQYKLILNTKEII